ncbi:uncharacterized protein CTRU02_207631 [Colletotrichum truncatum]|uniref:Uncharacterized protein n=1 Tax=Colletotrichum truncatum TaxID=5467 RepID=A0ACC3Z1I7_COLTU|nr:uncharacterized protein CTRU02_09266 [Colletotrichum truncatum]KAF6788945.1 hypothetical protein CTRU02_09266 [Colletotrichum truncatum]
MTNSTQTSGITGIVDQKMGKQFHEEARQSAFMHSVLLRNASEEGEYNNEPGGALLESGSLASNISQPQNKASSDLNPTTSPWVPEGVIAREANKVNPLQSAWPQMLAKMNENTHSVAGMASKNCKTHQDQYNGTVTTQTYSDTPTDWINLTLYNNSLAVPAFQLDPGTCDAAGINPAYTSTHVPQECQALTQQKGSIWTNTVVNGHQLSGSASMGDLVRQTPVRQMKGASLQNSNEAGEMMNSGGVLSPGDGTPKASNHGLMTEPRNFAPRASFNGTQLEAPPKFDLGKGKDENHTFVTESNDPFITQNSLGSSVELHQFGPQTSNTNLILTGQVSVSAPIGKAVNYGNLDHKDQSFNITGAYTQPPLSNGLQFQSVQGIPLQDGSGNGDGGITGQQGDGSISTEPIVAQNGTVVPYQVNYSSALITTPHGAPIPEYIRAQRSPELNRLTATTTGLPTVDTALHQANFPFIEPASRSRTVMIRGVVKIGNIPFVTNRAEIIAVLGRNSRILNDSEEPVHIIMERVTGKTTDAYVEFQTLEDATKAVEKHQQNINRGRITRIGQRPVEIELSSQAALMKDLFPSARGVFWNGCNPQVLPHNAEEPWENFKGFVSIEEMTMLVKHVEVPHRSPFSKECPQRPFECVISTLTKFPWHMKSHITVQQRHAVHKATCDLLRILVGSIRDRRDEVNLTQRLLKRVVGAAMRCEGFSTAQKDDIAYLVGMDEMEQRAFGQPRFAESWRHLYVLVPKTGVPLDWYIAVIREETSRFLETQPFQEKSQTRAIGDATDGYFGYFWRELNHHAGPAFDSVTLSQLAMHEYQTMESIIRRALTITNVH